MTQHDIGGLIDIKEASELLNLSVETLRKYKGLGIIKVATRDGRKDLYYRTHIQTIGDKILELKRSGLTINEITNNIKSDWNMQPVENQATQIMKAKKILIVEDDKIFVELVVDKIYSSLSKEQLSIGVAYNGLDAITIATRHIPDLIILDVGLPKKDGIVVYNELKQHKELDNCKYIIITGTFVFKPPGAVMLTKPCEMQELLDEIKKALNIG
jgi:CheY-like chemotaxis protein